MMMDRQKEAAKKSMPKLGAAALLLLPCVLLCDITLNAVPLAMASSTVMSPFWSSRHQQEREQESSRSCAAVALKTNKCQEKRLGLDLMSRCGNDYSSRSRRSGASNGADATFVSTIEETKEALEEVTSNNDNNGGEETDSSVTPLEVVAEKVKHNVKVESKKSSGSGGGGGGGNPVANLAGFIKSSIVGFKDNTVKLYTNHQGCNAIRAKQKSFAINTAESDRFVPRGYTPSNYQQAKKKGDSNRKTSNPGGVYQRTGISYAEYNFLQQGKADRGKVGQLMFLMVFSPNFLPYAFWIFPNIMPTPFMKSAGGPGNRSGMLTPWGTAVQSRVHAVLHTMCAVEQEAMNEPVVSGGISLNPFGGGKKLDAATQKQGTMSQLYNEAKDVYLPLLSESAQAKQPTAPHGLRKWKNKLLHPQSGAMVAALSASESWEEDRCVVELVHRSRIEGEGEGLIEVSAGTSESPSEGHLTEMGPGLVLGKVASCLNIFSTIAPTKGMQRLVGVPKPLLDGLSSAVFDTSPTPGARAPKTGAIATVMATLTPNVVTRNKLVIHLATLEEQDEFFVFESDDPKDENSPVNRLALEELYQACHDRCIGTSTSSEAQLRNELNKWLEYTVQQPRQVFAQQEGSSENLYYNGNMARVVLMCANAAEATMEERTCSTLPPLLFP
jgi:hypothetical protein